MIDYPFTAVPNWFFQVAPTLKEAELRIMLQVWFDTAGRHKNQNILAYSYIAETTGITNTSSISKALKSLEKRELITRQPGRVAGQKITVSPAQLPAGLPVVLTEGESTTHLKSVTTHLKRVDYSPKVSHNKNQTESMNLESTTEEKFTDSELESLAIVVAVGIDQQTARRLVEYATENGRDISYFKELQGYVASISAKNPAGFMRHLIERNAGVKWPDSAFSGDSRPVKLDKYAHGGVQHKLAESTCSICHPELFQERLEAES